MRRLTTRPGNFPTILQAIDRDQHTDSIGNVTTAAEAMAQRFRDAGFPEATFTCSVQ